MIHNLFDNSRFFILGHRGCSELFPENTLASFSDCASDSGIDGVELDVRLTKDSQIVISHDGHLRRTAGKDLEIADLLYDDLKKIDVGKGEHVPLLEDVFSTFGKRFVYDIEIKAEHMTGNRKLCLAVWDMICAHELQENVMVSSFNPFALRRFNRACWYSVPTADIFATGAGPKAFQNGSGYRVSGSSYMKPCIDLVNDSLIKRNDCPIIVWTVNTKEDALRMASFEGVRGLIGNNPHMLAKAVREKNDKK